MRNLINLDMVINLLNFSSRSAWVLSKRDA